MTAPLTIWVGHDPREQAAYDVAVFSLLRRTTIPVTFAPISATHCKPAGFKRPWKMVDGQRIDDADGKPFSTEFSFARFMVPFLKSTSDIAVFFDCDFLWRADIADLMRSVDPRHAVSVVQHDYRPAETVKMDNCAQERYARKNWSSLVVWNLRHPGNARLTLGDVNTKPGAWLHGFAWLADDEIGRLDPSWNWLDGGGSSVQDGIINPKVVHHTRGAPCLPGWENVAFADEWRQEKAVLDASRERRPTKLPTMV